MEKIYRQMDVRWTQEEMAILSKAVELCRKCAEDEMMEDWAQENCRESFFDMANYLQDYIDCSV